MPLQPPSPNQLESQVQVRHSFCLWQRLRPLPTLRPDSHQRPNPCQPGEALQPRKSPSSGCHSVNPARDWRRRPISSQPLGVAMGPNNTGKQPSVQPLKSGSPQRKSPIGWGWSSCSQRVTGPPLNQRPYPFMPMEQLPQGSPPPLSATAPGIAAGSNHVAPPVRLRRSLLPPATVNAVAAPPPRVPVPPSQLLLSLQSLHKSQPTHWQSWPI